MLYVSTHLNFYYDYVQKKDQSSQTYYLLVFDFFALAIRFAKWSAYFVYITSLLTSTISFSFFLPYVIQDLLLFVSVGWLFPLIVSSLWLVIAVLILEHSQDVVNRSWHYIN